MSKYCHVLNPPTSTRASYAIATFSSITVLTTKKIILLAWGLKTKLTEPFQPNAAPVGY